MKHIQWTGKSLKILDQRKLPTQVRYNHLDDIHDCYEAIVSMQIRGAPIIGIVGAFGLALFAQRIDNLSPKEALEKLEKGAEYISSARPTAYNLRYCVDSVLESLKEQNDIKEIKKKAVEKALELMENEKENSRMIGEYGAKLLKDGDTVLTHCNAGALATIEYGTALAPIRIATEKGKCIYTIVTETRPAQQGARLTTWELNQDRIPVTLISDTAVGYVMKNDMVDKVIVGADRITAEGYVFNKIGTYQIAVLAKEHNIPFYVAAPSSTFDLDIMEDEVVIEERDSSEITTIGGKRIAPKGIRIFNPVFDCTPPSIVKAIISEKGTIYPPYRENIRKVFFNQGK
jgi:methylthioribose-1-phosphate isomerase